jgi:N-methylhydantoinase A
MRVGVEIGGTFTDLVCADGDAIYVVKVPSVPRRPDEGAFAALDAAGITFPMIQDLVHGSTVATNAVLERKGAHCAFLVTAGFRDTLLLRRGEREQLFNPFHRLPEPLVQRRDTLEVPERVLADGAIERPFEAEVFWPTLEAFLDAGRYDAVAICLLNAFANPAHERALAALIRARMPHLPVTCSFDVTREFREYERASTTVLSAYVQPVIDAYLSRITDRLRGGGFPGTLSIMQSSGGRIPAEAMRRNAVTALLSGPAAGVTGAIHLAGLSGAGNLITLDIGGTSADVCLVENGRAALTKDAKVDGHPVLLPMVDITTVGAGGGSLVWIDDGGLLRVGPRSAGADPGPACYGRGGSQPTLTDAQLLCGRLRPEARLAASMTLDRKAAEAAFRPVAHALDMTVAEAAESVVRIFIANVVAAIRLVSTRRGHDPRDYVLVPYGGAGPLHAAQVADALGIATVLVPPNPGVISAYGLLAADHSLHGSLTRRARLDDKAPAMVREAVSEVKLLLEEQYRALGLEGDQRLDVVVDMRFIGQAYEISVPIETALLPVIDAATLRRLFDDEHRKIYRHGGVSSSRPVEIVSYRVGLHVPLAQAPDFEALGSDTPFPLPETYPLIDGSQPVPATWISRAGLQRDAVLDGPAIVEDRTATTFVPSGWTCTVDAAGNIILRRLS